MGWGGGGGVGWGQLHSSSLRFQSPPQREAAFIFRQRLLRVFPVLELKVGKKKKISGLRRPSRRTTGHSRCLSTSAGAPIDHPPPPPPTHGLITDTNTLR